MVPYDKPEPFVGRDSLLRQIRDELCDPTYAYQRRLALYGLGGVGKTHTAIGYVHSMKSYYHSIFWINAVDYGMVASGFQQMALKTKCAEGIPDTNIAEVTNKVLEWLLRQSKWLLVIDNLDDVSVIDGKLPSIECQGHTLITTRNPNTEGIPARGLEVPVLDVESATNLFYKYLGDHWQVASELESIRSEVTKIVTELGGLPLAIEQSAAYLRETKDDIAQFLPLYNEGRSTRQELYSWIPEGNRRYHHSVTTTWRMA